MEFKINENTTYINYLDDDTLFNRDKKAVKFTKENGSNLIVEFNPYCETDADWRDNSVWSTHYVDAEIYTQKQSILEKAKNKLLKKLLKLPPQEEDDLSKKVLFSKTFYGSFSEFLEKPVKLEPEYQSINKVLESARQVVATYGYKFDREASKIHQEQREAKRANEQKAASAKRSAIDKKFADKFKGFEK